MRRCRGSKTQDPRSKNEDGAPKEKTSEKNTAEEVGKDTFVRYFFPAVRQSLQMPPTSVRETVT